VAAGKVSKDSWSRCEAPSMLYDAVRKPNAPYQPPRPCVNPAGKSLDTLESTQQRLRREMLNKLDNKGLEFPHESYVAVVQVGKYVFLAIMLPVYFCCYGLPRWFLANAIPQLFLAIKNQVIHVGRYIAERTLRVKDLMKGMLEQLIGDSLKLSKDRARNLWNFFSTKWQGTIQNLFNKVKALSQKSEIAKNKFVDKSAKLINHAELRTNEINRWLVGKSRDLTQRFLGSFKSAFNTVDRLLLTPLIATVSLLFKPIFKMSKFAKKIFKVSLEAFRYHVKRMVNSVISKIKKFVKTKVEDSKKAIERLLEPLSNSIIEKKEMVSAFFHQLKIAFIEPVGYVSALVSGKLASMAVAGSRFAKKSFRLIPSTAQRLLRFALKMGSRRFKEKMKQGNAFLFGLGKAVKGIFAGLISGIMEIFLFIFQFIKKIINGILAFIRFWRRLVQLIKNQLSSIPKKLFKFTFLVFKFLGRMVAKILFVGQIIIALICIACGDAFNLARELSISHSKEPVK